MRHLASWAVATDAWLTEVKEVSSQTIKKYKNQTY
jgi:hypothetical protein